MWEDDMIDEFGIDIDKIRQELVFADMGELEDATLAR